VYLLPHSGEQALSGRARPTAAGAAEQHRGGVTYKGDIAMPDWFTPVIIILSLIALVLFVAFWTTRKSKYVGGAVLALSAIVLVWLIARAIPTDRRALEAALNDIAAGVNARNTDRVFANLSADFTYRTYNKSSLQGRADSHIRRGDIDDLEIWNIEVTSVSRKDKKADVEFNVRPIGISQRGEFFLCRSVFVLEDDGKWRMKTFELYNPFVETNRAIDFPGLN
jgi:hypothetical protein